jgi:hypothetical protein
VGDSLAEMAGPALKVRGRVRPFKTVHQALIPDFAFLSSSSSRACPLRSVTPDFPKETKCKPICMPGSSFMHIADISE